MHPIVMEEIATRVESLRGNADVVVLDIPLLVEVGGGSGLDVRITVEAPEDLRLERLHRERGMEPSEALARMAAQATDAQRRALADIVIMNDGSEEALRARVDSVWAQLQDRAR